MGRLAGIVLALVLWSSLLGAQVDSAKLVELDSRLAAYLETLGPERLEVKSRECDALIESAQDRELRNHIARKIYDHYFHSPVMGDEAVAIHLTDKWFSTGQAEFEDEMALMDAKIFADFNRQSLLGLPAPELTLYDRDSAQVRFGGPDRRYRILMFYDTGCAKCKLETMMLRSLLDTKDYPVDLYAVCTGPDKESWQEWVSTRLKLKAVNTRVINTWDPQVESGYQMKYGVLQTPRIFLVDKGGIIIGRAMDTDAIEQLLDMVAANEDYTYGSDASEALMDQLFAVYGDTLNASSVLETAGRLKSRTLDKGDTLLFKHLEGDLFYYITSRRSEAFKAAGQPFLNEYIFGKPEVWNTPEDSLKVLGMAEIMNDLLSRSPAGSKIPKERIKGWNRFRRKGGYLIFHTEGCPVCKAELAAAASMGVRYFDVNIDKLMASDPELARHLLDTFDLSGLPFMMEIGRKGVVKRKYISLVSYPKND